MRRTRLAAVVILVASASPWGPVPGANAEPTLPQPVTRMTDLETTFANYGDGGCARWSGGDGTQSVKLPSGDWVWFFSDTYLGSPTKRPIPWQTSTINNSAVVMTGLTLNRTITGGYTCGEPSYFARPMVEGASSFYWNLDQTVVGSNLVKFWIRNDRSAVPWRELGSALTVTPVSDFDDSISVQTPQAITPHTPTGATAPIIWGVALLAHSDGYVYVYGTAKFGSTRRLYVARATPANLASPSSWRFRTSSGTWASGQTNAGQVSVGFVPNSGFSVTSVNGQLWLIQIQPVFGGGSVVAHPMSSPIAVSTNAVRLHNPPFPGGNSNYYLYYDAAVHEGYDGDTSRIVVSYNVNSTGVSIGCRGKADHVASIYRPRFLSVPKADLVVGNATALTTWSPGSTGASPALAPQGVVDNQWYEGSLSHTCPALNHGTTLTGSATTFGVSLSWQHYGRDIWYTVQRRDATAGGAWTTILGGLWSTTNSATDYPLLDHPGTNGHQYQYRVQPFANFGGGTAPWSNTLTLTVP